MADTYPKNTIDDNGLKKVWDMVMDRLGLKVDKEAGKGLSTNDYTTTEKDKLAGIASGAEVNTITSVAGKTGAVELTKSDVGLNNVGNFKAVSTSANQGLTDTEKTNARANIDASSIGDIESTKTVSGNPITVNDAAPINAEDITVDITPKQDLHGYDRPWAGGAGKNKLPMTVANLKARNTSGTWSGNTYTRDGVTVKMLVDSADNVTGFELSGNASANMSFHLATKAELDTLPSGSYIMNGCPAGGAGDGSTYYLGFYAPNKSKYDMGNDVTISLSGNEDVSANIFIRISSGYAIQGSLIFYPMIRLSTETDATFAPYSNICPIEGWTDAKLDRVGKNKLPMTVSILKSINTVGTWNGNTYISNGVSCEVLTDESNENVHGIKVTGAASKNIWFRITPNTTDVNADTILSGCPASGSFETYCLRMLQSNDATPVGNDTGSGLSIPSAYNDVNLYIRIASGYTVPTGGLLFYPMIRLATETDATYEPYQGQQYTADFGETVYGGKWHVTEGGTDNEMANVDLSSLTWSLSSFLPNTFYATISPYSKSDYSKSLASNYKYVGGRNGTNSMQNDADGSIALYNGNNAYEVYIKDKRYSTAEEFNSASLGTLAILLATPTTISTPKQTIPMLQGINTVSADCGDTQLKYQPDNVIGELKGEIEDNIIYEDFKWTTESSQSYSAGTPGTYGTSSWRDVRKEGYDVIGVTFVENRRFGDCILTLYYIPSTNHVEVIIFRATSSAVTIADEDIEYRVAYKKRT